MALRAVGALALSISVAAAFQDTSPLFILSTSKLADGFDGAGIVSSSLAGQEVANQLSGCPSDSYVVVNQPGVSSVDFSHTSSAPHLRRRIANENGALESVSVVPEVVGGISAMEVVNVLEKNCKAARLELDASDGYVSIEETVPQVIKVEFSALPSSPEERLSELGKHDSYLNAVLSSLQNKSYTVIYTGTPPSGQHMAPGIQHPVQGYEMDEPFPSSLHTDLKRDVSSHSNVDSDEVALFEKYQFLSPGIFMSLFVSLILFLILYVGVTALAGLEVSYFAFSKEMGPAAQKSKMQ
ncbi:BIG1-domain-containing protein [Saccharata proteae CBS 121410]|uniref:Protein BIG1 n=1 Tax=Saccharata proteae CBS 121410 TaxID=1314787 RepID=A0A9P4HP61_9PEZI|nr:BIG1-domain-containing protein [Saccharata proteae CBS 121410]